MQKKISKNGNSLMPGMFPVMPAFIGKAHPGYSADGRNNILHSVGLYVVAEYPKT